MARISRNGPGEGRRRANAALQDGAHFLELRGGEPAAGPSGVHQLAVLVRAQVERAEPRARPIWSGEAHDAEVVEPVPADLEPVRSPAGAVGALHLVRH